MRPLIPLSAVFAVAGGVIAFLLRPTDIFGHQLPLSIVLTRGSNLQGINQLLTPLAQRSFNELAAGLIIGAVLGVIVSALIGRR